MLPRASLAFLHIAGKERDNGVKIGTCDAPDPVVWMIRAGCAQDVRSGGHSLTKLFRKSSQRLVIDAKSLQAIPRERYGHPPGIERARPNGLCGTYLRTDAC